MTEQLRLTGKETVLEIGTGSGYQTAILAELAAKVYSIEIRPELAARRSPTAEAARDPEREVRRRRRLPRLARGRAVRRHPRDGRAGAHPAAAPRAAGRRGAW